MWLICTACGGSLTAEHGQFTSPGYPDAYTGNVECVWNIDVSPGNRLMISFRYHDVMLLGTSAVHHVC